MPTPLPWLMPLLWLVSSLRPAHVPPLLKQRSQKLALCLGLLLLVLMGSRQAQAVAPTVSVAGAPLSFSTAPGTTQTITVTYSDADGNADLKNAQLIINTSGTPWAWQAVCVMYDAVANKLYLRNDDDSAWLGGVAPGTATTLTNSLGSLNCAATTLTRNGNDLTVAWSVTAGSSLDGINGIYPCVQDIGGAQTAYPYPSYGTWTISGQSPSIVAQSSAIALNTSIGQERSVTTTYRDPDGALSLRNLWVLVGKTNSTRANAISCFYDARNNLLYLQDDAATGVVNGIGYAPGTDIVLSNTQGSLNCKGTTVTRNGTDFIINWKLTPKAALVGSNVVWAYCNDRGARTSGLPFSVTGYTWQVTTEAPLQLTGVPGDGRVTLTWTVVTGATGYGVLRGWTTGGPYTVLTTSLPASSTTYTNTGLSLEVPYFYVVYPIFGASRGGDSNEVTVIPKRASPSGDIVLTGTAGDQKILLSWTLSANAGSYRIWRRVGNGNSTWSQLPTISAPATSYTDTGLTNGTIYSYRVRGRHNSGEGLDSNVVVLTPGQVAPPAPDIPSFGTVTNTTIQVIPPTLPFGATSLKLYMGINSDLSQIRDLVATGITTTTPITVTGLTLGANYYFRAEAVNSYGSTSGPSAFISTSGSRLQPPPGPPSTPDKPLIGAISYSVIPGSMIPIGLDPISREHVIRVWGVFPMGTDSLVVQWKQQGEADTVFSQSGHEINTTYGGTVLSGYADIGAVPQGSTTGMLQGSTTYVFRLKAINSSGSTVGTATASATTLADPPAKPAAVTVTSQTDHDVTISVPALPAGATNLTLYWGAGTQFMGTDSNGVPTVVNGGSDSLYPALSMRMSGQSSVTIGGFKGGSGAVFVWGASNGTLTTFGNVKQVLLSGSGLAAPEAPIFVNVWQNYLEVLVPANIPEMKSNASSTQVKLRLQVKPTGSTDAFYQDLLFGGGGGPTGDEHKESGTNGSAAITGHPELEPLHPARRVRVNDLVPGKNYTFRFVSFAPYNASVGETPGVPASITMPTEYLQWAANLPISSGGIRYPWAGMIAHSGQTYRLNSFAAADWDVLTHTVSGFWWDQRLTSPTLTAWSADAGTFPEGYSSPTVMWQAPTVAATTYVTIVMQVDDVGNTNIGKRENGVRDDPMLYANDRPLQFKVTIRVDP